MKWQSLLGEALASKNRDAVRQAMVFAQAMGAGSGHLRAYFFMRWGNNLQRFGAVNEVELLIAGDGEGVLRFCSWVLAAGLYERRCYTGLELGGRTPEQMLESASGIWAANGFGAGSFRPRLAAEIFDLLSDPTWLPP